MKQLRVLHILLKYKKITMTSTDQ